MSLRKEKIDNIEIIQGHNTASYFWIMPVDIKMDGKSGEPVCERKYDYEISIEEDDVFSYLAYFLFRHFDGELAVNKARQFAKDFDWNLEDNFYTYGDVKNMLADIRGLLTILCDETDENSKRAKIAVDYPAEATMGYAKIDLEHNAFDGYYTLSAVIRFYEEFCKLMERMMDACDDLSLISFMGP